MRVPITFRGGRLPHDDSRPAILLADVLDKKLPAPPASADWLSAVPAYAWGMLGNDTLGDCTCAGVGHKRIGDVYANQGRILEVTTAETIKFYENFGYNPDDPNSDQGAVCQQVLEAWHKVGFLGEKPVAFAKVKVSSLTEVKQAIATFGQIYCGFDVPDSAMGQFNDSEPWIVVPGAQIEGGHCVTVGAYDADGPSCVTWGAVQPMTWEFWKRYFREAWVIVGPDDYNPATGHTRDGLDGAALAKAYTAVTGRRMAAASPGV
jgi:hypothetical protein